MVSTRAWKTSLCLAVCKDLTFGLQFQPEAGERHFARQFAKLDFWQVGLQPEPGECHFARQLAKLDFWQ